MTTQEFTPEELATEVWRPIPGFPSYAVSDIGRIKRTAPCRGTWVGRILRPGMCGSGYLEVNLGMGSRAQTSMIMVHRAVALTFIGPRPSGMTINHLDLCKTNNRASNLEYCTQKENLAHAAGLDRAARGERHGCAKLTLVDIQQIRLMLAEGYLQREVASKFSVTRENIGRIKRGESWKTTP